MYDVLCYGAICADLRMWLPRFPQPGAGVHVRAASWAAGGNALNEARVLRDLGAQVALLGDTLGTDPAGMLLSAALTQLELHTHIMRDPALTTPVCHILITPDGQRTILALREPPPPFVPPAADLLAACRLVSVTRYGPHTGAFAAAAAAAGRPLLVADATRPDDALSAVADVIVTSAELLNAHTPGVTIAAQMAALHVLRAAAVVVTDGPRAVRALWAEAGERQWYTYDPPAIVATDTTGAGDAFRAGLAWGMLQALPWPQRLSLACATAQRYLAAA